MYKIQPPFRADQVGSLLRPKDLLKKDINGKKVSFRLTFYAKLKMRPSGTVKKVESIGMKAITDGEFRRDYFHLDFLQQLEGVTVTGGIGCKPSCKSSGRWLHAAKAGRHRKTETQKKYTGR